MAIILCIGLNGPMDFAFAEDDSSVYTEICDDATYHYTINETGGAVLTSVIPDGSVTGLSLPEAFDGHPLQTLEDGCFDLCGGLEKLTISAHVSSIEDGALDGCTGLEIIEVSPDNPVFLTKDGALLQQKEERVGESNLFVSKLYLVFYPPEKRDTYYFLPYGVVSAEKLKSNYLEILELSTEEGFSGSINDFPSLRTLIIDGEDLRYYECYQNLDTLVIACDSGLPEYTAEEILPSDLHVIGHAGSPAQEWAERDGAQFKALETSSIEIIEPVIEQYQTSIKHRITDETFNYIAQSNATVEYATTNTQIATIDENGKVTLAGGGESDLYAYTRYDGQYLPNCIKFMLLIEKDPFPTSIEAIHVTPGCDPFYIQVNKKYDDLDLTFYTDEDETVLTVTPEGLVNLFADKPGIYIVYADSQETRKASASTLLIPIVIDRIAQVITGPKKLNVVYGTTVKLNIKSMTPVRYRSSNRKIAKVTSDGVVTFSRPGKVKIHMVANPDDTYLGNTFLTKITCKIGKPKLKAKAGKKKIKLSWNNVYAAQKYLIYCKAPGQKSFKLVTTKLASVKSVTHNNLKKGKKYTYKVRVFTKIKGKKYYSPYSDPVTVKVR